MRFLRWLDDYCAHVVWIARRRLFGPACRLGYCIGCGVPLGQVERSPGIWRPWWCDECWELEHKEAA